MTSTTAANNISAAATTYPSHILVRAGIDEASEEPWRDDAADSGAGRIENINRQGAHLERNFC